MPYEPPDQSDYLINQWVRDLKPGHKEAISKRRESGLGQKKIRDPLTLNFPLGFPSNNNTTPVNLPAFYAGGINPNDNDDSTDYGGGGGGHSTDTVTFPTFPSTTTTGGTGGTESPASIVTPDDSTIPLHSTIVTGTAGTPFTIVSFETGGGVDLGCFECNFGFGDPRLPCLNPFYYCREFNGDGGLCGFGGSFCPSAISCRSSDDCEGVVGPGNTCCVGSDDHACTHFSVICCYSDGSVVGDSRSCCTCNQ